MSRHLWILGRLLTMKRLSAQGPEKSSNDDSARLLHYIVATCCPKMIQRLNHKTLSVPLIEALEQIRTFTFEESKLDQEQKEGDESDLLFLTTFLPHAAPELHIPIPKIMEKIKGPSGIEGRSAFRLYTQETCLEFHQLLVQLLLRFRSSLAALVTYRKGLEFSTQSPQDTKDEVERAVIYGYALHRLTKGAALPMHLKIIAPLLRSLNLGGKITMPTPAPGEEQEEPKELDEELKAVQPFVEVDGVETPLWQSYLDWLRLMVAHFDAADILLTYVTGPSFVHHTISIQVLVAPPVDERLLPLKELLNDPTLFPTTTTAASPHNSQATITNREILEFLEEGFKHSSHVKGINTRWTKRGQNPSNIKTIKGVLEDLKISRFEGWSLSATKLLDALNASPIDSSKITEDIESLWASCAFFTSLEKSQRKFKGTLHCEVCLASLLDETATFSGEILAQMKVGCAPTCSYH